MSQQLKTLRHLLQQKVIQHYAPLIQSAHINTLSPIYEEFDMQVVESMFQHHPPVISYPSNFEQIYLIEMRKPENIKILVRLYPNHFIDPFETGLFS